MKIKVPIGPLAVTIVTAILVMLIPLVPFTAVRLVIGLPLLLFFPGYSLVAGLFPGRTRPLNLEWITLCFGMSVAIAGLLGLVLNYSPWGITLGSVLYSVGGFVVLMSTIAWIRRSRLQRAMITELDIKLPGWDGNALSKTLSVAVVLSVATTIGILSYTAIAPRNGERFSEFYILGLNGKAQDYPTTFLLQGSQVTRVIYGHKGTAAATDVQGTVTLGIVNREQQTAVYSLKITIDGEPVNIQLGGATRGVVGDIELHQGDKWENVIGIVPQHEGDNQRVEFLLFRGLESTPQQSLHIWINARQAN